MHREDHEQLAAATAGRLLKGQTLGATCAVIAICKKTCSTKESDKRGYAEIQGALLLEVQKLLAIIFSFAEFSHNLLERGTLGATIELQ